MYVLKCPKGMNVLSPPYLPVEIVEFITYAKKNITRYRLCSKDAILNGIYGREQLKPRLFLTEKGMGIHYESLDKYIDLD